MSTLVVIAVIIGIYMAWNIGANDVANSMADAVGSKAITIFWAVILAGICEFLGAVLVGSHVTNTIRKGIIDTDFFKSDPMLLAHGMFCALLAAGLWLNLASFFGMPVSTTHSIIGAIVGFGIVVAGAGNINWGKMGQIVASWFISPVAGGIASFIIFRIISRYLLAVEHPIQAARKGLPICSFFTFLALSMATIYKGLKNLSLNLNFTMALVLSCVIGLVAAIITYFCIRNKLVLNTDISQDDQVIRVEKSFGLLVIITSCTVAFAHGANDVANAIGPLAAVIEIVNTNSVPTEVSVDFWILLLGGFGIVLGLAMFGYRVMTVVGTKVTEITPSRGVAADLAAMMTVLVCSRMGLPISTTHTLVGAIIGVAMARGITAVDKRTVSSIFVSWIITVPIAAVLCIAIYGIAKLTVW